MTNTGAGAKGVGITQRGESLNEYRERLRQLLSERANKSEISEETISTLSKALLVSASFKELQIIEICIEKGIPLLLSGERSNKKNSTLRFRIDQEPLTLHNLSAILSSLTELSTKYWLISQGRFADLIEYTQTRNPRFEEESDITVGKVTHNSPLDINLNVGKDVAEALVITIDGVTQIGKRLKKAELEIQEKEQQIEHAQQKADHEQQMDELEREKQKLEIERQRLEIYRQQLELQQQQLEFQKKRLEYAIEMTGPVVDMLHPGIDPDTRAMAIQTVLPNLIQLQNGPAIELVLPPIQNTQPEEKK